MGIGLASMEVSFVPSLLLSLMLTSLDLAGPLFLLPGIVFALYITQAPIPEEWKIEIAR